MRNGDRRAVARHLKLGLGAIIVAAATFATAQPAAAASSPSSVFDGNVPCSERPDGATFCNAEPRSTAHFDGVPIDVNVSFPSPSRSADGPYPLMMIFHGYASSSPAADKPRWLSAATPSSRWPTAASTNPAEAPPRAAAGPPATRATSACSTPATRSVTPRLRRIPRRRGLVTPDKIAATGRLLRRRPVHGAGRPEEPDHAARRHPRPLEEPGRQAHGDRGRDPEHPLDRPRLLAGPNGSTLDYVKDNSYYGPVSAS